jgi:adenine-specific DNA methylase
MRKDFENISYTSRIAHRSLLSIMFNQSKTTPNGWLAFELNVLSRLKFASAISPFTSEPNLCAYLKRWNVRVLANDLSQAGWIKALAVIENNAEKLTEEDVNTVLEDAYVPRYRLQNQSLGKWFNETDAWWFDNVRQNIEQLSSHILQAIALNIAMSVGDYVLSFDEETRQFRQPLSNVFKRLWSIQPEPVNNGQNNTCRNKTANDFIAENFADLIFLQLPQARNKNQRDYLGKWAWREEWLQGGEDFWNDLERRQAGKLGTLIETKHQYLHLFEEILQTASHIPIWAISHTEDGFISTSDIVETIGRSRRVDTVFTKDFSELTGAKAVVITA